MGSIVLRLPVLLLSLVVTSQVVADESTEALAAIKKLGGSARQAGEGWHVDFHLRGRGLTDADLRHVAALEDVVWLNLSETKVTNAGLVHLKGLEKLRWLHLEKTRVGDDGVKHIVGMTKLEYLNLFATSITDQSLDHLSRSRSLRRLYVWQTDVTDDGVARLTKANPDLRVVRGVDLSKLPAIFPDETAQPKPKLALDWVAATSRSEAPARSESGANCQVFFENRSARPVKLYWISFGAGTLRLYATIAPGATHQQNTYSRNAWLVTDEAENPLGYFVVKEADSHAVIPSQK